jgi:UDP-N-acetylmuramoyl-tripeptide--D-alanyl-D-alanine ligase
MTDSLLIPIVLTWLIGACVRVYRQARFYQIEEYMPLRYGRWWLSQRARWLPTRPIVAGLVGALGVLVLAALVPDVPLPLIALVGLLSAWWAVWPPKEREVKKAFRRTPRAVRLLVASFIVTALAMLIMIALELWLLPVGGLSPAHFVGFTLVGLLLYLLAPLWLIAGNTLMMPVEWAIRQRYIALARRVLAQSRTINIGITGSYGKTSTKVALAHILNGRFKALPTPKSFNTLMGVTTVINNTLAHDHSYDYFIVEMGAYIRGEIQRLCDLTHPQITMVIEVGPQHLERFGSLENIAIAKYEIIKALPPDGLGVFNWDNPYVRTMYERGYPANRIAVSRSIDPASAPANGPRFIASDVSESLQGLSFTVTDAQTGESQPFVTPLVGVHNVTNILMATAVAVHEGMPLRDVARRVRTLEPAESRLVRQTTPEGITIINDAYSANPAGIVSALRVLGMHTHGRRVLITPGMVELADLHETENRKLGETAAEHATDVVLVGAVRTQPIADGLLSKGFPSDRLHVVDTLSEAVAWYKGELRAGDTVLFMNDLPDTY